LFSLIVVETFKVLYELQYLWVLLGRRIQQKNDGDIKGARNCFENRL